MPRPIRNSSSSFFTYAKAFVLVGVFVLPAINYIYSAWLDGSESLRLWLYVAGGVFVLASIGGIWLAYVRWNRGGRDWRWDLPSELDNTQAPHPRQIGLKEAVVVEYAPPSNFPPAMVALLLNDSVDSIDLYYSLVDLARRGYVEMHGRPEYLEVMNPNNLYTFRPTGKLGEDLFKFEQCLLADEYDNTPDGWRKFDRAVRKSEQVLHQEVKELGLYTRLPGLASGQGRAVSFVVILSSLFVLLGGSFMVTLLPKLAFILIAVAGGMIVSGVAFAVVGGRMPKKTAKGYDHYRRVLGYAEFVTHATHHKGRFINNQTLFDEVFVYSLLMNSRDEIRKLLEMFPIPPYPSWISTSKWC